ncbi:MAG: PAS domain-containing protein [Verrucomicrobia bacterium]|nr:PAS domain-containing protein [Verrucomicrobiota bacterium]
MQFTPVQKAFFERLSSPVIGEELFDLFPDQVFFIKDQMARYIVVNQSFVDRCGFQSKSQVIGRTAQDVYPNPFGENYYEQDLMILAEGKGVTNHLELHLYPGNIQGWCLTNKIPIKNSNGAVVGLIGISRDIRDYGRSTDSLADISAAIEYIQKNYMFPLKVVEVAAQFDISLYQFEQKLQRLMHMSPPSSFRKPDYRKPPGFCRLQKIPGQCQLSLWLLRPVCFHPHVPPDCRYDSLTIQEKIPDQFIASPHSQMETWAATPRSAG